VNHGILQDKVFEDRQQGIGGWFLTLDAYKSWIATAGQMLFRPGLPGAGKTILTSIIIADLKERYRKDPTVGISFLYCATSQPENQRPEEPASRSAAKTVDDMMATLLKQLVERQNPLPSSIAEW
jgi:hypothetical protein